MFHVEVKIRNYIIKQGITWAKRRVFQVYEETTIREMQNIEPKQIFVRVRDQAGQLKIKA